MEIDRDKIDEAVLALLYLGWHDDIRTGKTFDWDAMDRLHAKGMIFRSGRQSKVRGVQRGGATAIGAAVQSAIRCLPHFHQPRGPLMTLPKPQAIWREQCEAARRIKERYGLNAALDYLVAEKLLNHASAAAQNADFARELPGFVAEVRRMFELHDITNYLAQMERRDREEEADLVDDEDDAFTETASERAARKRRFALIKELLTRSQLGTA